jgi:cation transport ATPase
MTQKAHIAHHVKGRLRLKLPAGKNNADLLERIQRGLVQIPGADRIEVNLLTGSIVVQYEPSLHQGFRERLAAFATDAGLFALHESASPDSNDETRQLVRDIQTEMEYLAKRSRAAETILSQARKANLAVKKATENSVDLNVLVPLGVATVSAVAIGLKAATPLWLTLAIFSFHSFVALHSQPPAMELPGIPPPSQSPGTPQAIE